MSKAPVKKASPPGASGKPVKGQPNWLLILIWGISFFFLLQFLNNKGDKQVVHTLAENIATFQQQCKNLEEGSSNATLATITQQIKDTESNAADQVKKGKLDANVASIQKQNLDDEEYKCTILEADVQLRAGRLHTDLNDGKGYQRFDVAYNQVLFPALNKYGDLPIWKEPVQTVDEKGVTHTYTGAELYARSVSDLSAANKTSTAWGLPGYQLIDWLVHLTGANPGFSYWFAPLLLAVLVRASIWPLTQKQLMFGRQASQLTPLLKEVKAKYKDDQTMQQKKTMELYGEYGINPLAGCWPIFIQMPLFWAVYACMLRYKFEFQKGTFLWINQHSHDLHPFFAPNLGQKDMLLILIYGATLLCSTMLTPVSDPTQVKQQRLMGVSMSLLFPIMMLTGAYPVPAAFVLYWTFTNVVATVQSLRAYYLLPKPPLVKVNTATGGVRPVNAKTSFMDRMRDKYDEEMQRKADFNSEQAKNMANEDKGSKDADTPATSAANKTKSTSPPKAPGSGKQTPKRRK